MNKLLALAFTLVFATTASAQDRAVRSVSCQRGFLVSSGHHGLNIVDTQNLIAAVRGGAEITVGLKFLPGDKDSNITEFWFAPIAVSIRDDVVYAESAALKWPPSRYSSYDEIGNYVGHISLRVASNGELSSVQTDETAESEPIETTWCLR